MCDNIFGDVQLNSNTSSAPGHYHKVDVRGRIGFDGEWVLRKFFCDGTGDTINLERRIDRSIPEEKEEDSSEESTIALAERGPGWQGYANVLADEVQKPLKTRNGKSFDHGTYGAKPKPTRIPGNRKQDAIDPEKKLQSPEAASSSARNSTGLQTGSRKRERKVLTKLAKDEQEKKRVDKVKPPPEKGEEQRPSPNKARVAVKAKQQIAKEASKTATRTAAKKGGKARSGKKTVATKKGSVKDADEDELQGDDNEDHQKPATVTARKKGFR